MNKRFLVAGILVLAGLPTLVSAHTSGIFYETIVDGVHIDVGYSSAAPQAGESVIFDFNLSANSPAPKYTDVWVRVDSEEGNVVLATAVHNASFGGPRMSYVFPGPGKYTVSMRYENEGDAIAKASFPITVLPATGGGFFGMLTGAPWYVVSLISILLGAGVAVLILYLRSKKHTAHPPKK